MRLNLIRLEDQLQHTLHFHGGLFLFNPIELVRGSFFELFGAFFGVFRGRFFLLKNGLGNLLLRLFALFDHVFGFFFGDF